jgi:RecG-like helicase
MTTDGDTQGLRGALSRYFRTNRDRDNDVIVMETNARGRDHLIASHAGQYVTLLGRVQSTTLAGAGSAPVYRVTVNDGTGFVDLVFHGRTHIAGLVPGARLEATGRLIDVRGTQTLSNPKYTLLPHHDDGA